MYTESDLLPLSALQHLAFCERQAALIHVEQAWSENRLTMEGRILHERVHEQESESRRDVRIARGLKLRSLELGLSGITDVVEFHRDTQGVPVGDVPGLWRSFPVEYKRGKPKTDGSDEVQLCAQAMCLEEMLGADIEEGALFYGSQRRRIGVRFDEHIRMRVRDLAKKLHEIVRNGVVPAAEYRKCCRRCSLVGECMPQSVSRSAAKYVNTMTREIEKEGLGEEE